LQWLAEHVFKKDSNAYAYQRTIKRLTKDTRCAFVDKGNALQQQQPVPGDTPWIAPATSFVSHAWGCPFATAMEVMTKIAQEEHNQSGQESYFWFDVFSNNQHFPAPILASGVLSQLFGSTLLAIGRVDLVLSPWQGPWH
jgi:hypothetical protein